MKPFLAVTFFFGFVTIALGAESAPVVPWGDWLARLLNSPGTETLVVAIIGSIIARFVRNGPVAAQIDQVAVNSVNYAFASVAQAEKGKTVDLPTGNALLNVAEQYAIANAPKIVAIMGNTLRPKLLARISAISNIQPDATPTALGAELPKS